MSKETGKRGRTALVIGASMAGLLAARVLADHFEQVTLLERDEFPTPGQNRRGVPQGKHTHVLLERGRRLMDDLLPGLGEELTRAGAVTVEDVSKNVRWFHSGEYHRPGVSGIAGLAVSRPTLEALVRAQVLALPPVQAVDGRKVLGLLTTGDGDDATVRVTGVRLRGADGAEEVRRADLVVDATGRGSRTPTWLEEMGYRRPEEEQVEVRVGYTTCYYHRRPEHLPGLQGITLMPTPPDKRMAIILAQDGDRWVVTLGGYLGDHVPADYHAFLEAARQLPAPDIYRVIKDAERLSGPVSYQFRANLRRRYERLEHFPSGYLVIGDAICSFNPIYGQGMTVAALEAEALGESLAAGRDRLADRFFARAAEIVDASWDAAVGTDLGFPQVEGKRTPMVRFLNWYLGKLHVAAHDDAEVSIAFLKVINMLAPPPSILHPRIVWRVIKGILAARVQSDDRSNEIVAGKAALDVTGESLEPRRQAVKERP